MGAYFVIANLDAKERLYGESLALPWGFDEAQGEPPGNLPVWLLAKANSALPAAYRGRWADRRIVVAADEGETSALGRDAGRADRRSSGTSPARRSKNGSQRTSFGGCGIGNRAGSRTTAGR